MKKTHRVRKTHKRKRINKTRRGGDLLTKVKGLFSKTIPQGTVVYNANSNAHATKNTFPVNSSKFSHINPMDKPQTGVLKNSINFPNQIEFVKKTNNINKKHNINKLNPYVKPSVIAFKKGLMSRRANINKTRRGEQLVPDSLTINNNREAIVGRILEEGEKGEYLTQKIPFQNRRSINSRTTISTGSIRSTGRAPKYIPGRIVPNSSEQYVKEFGTSLSNYNNGISLYSHESNNYNSAMSTRSSISSLEDIYNNKIPFGPEKINKNPRKF
jgi:hypothetical protein